MTLIGKDGGHFEIGPKKGVMWTQKLDPKISCYLDTKWSQICKKINFSKKILREPFFGHSIPDYKYNTSWGKKSPREFLITLFYYYRIMAYHLNRVVLRARHLNQPLSVNYTGFSTVSFIPWTTFVSIKWYLFQNQQYFVTYLSIY